MLSSILTILTLLTLTSVNCGPVNWGQSEIRSGRVARSENEETLLNSIEEDKPEAELDHQPRHVHLSRKFELTSMTVTWSTKDFPDHPFVEWGTEESSLNQILLPITQTLNSRPETSRQYIHEVTLRDLTPGQSYHYRCVSTHGLENETASTSSIYKFRVSLDGTDWSPNFIFFGDLGVKNSVALAFLELEILKELYDATFHVGDIAYAMNDNGGEVGDEFMRMIENMAARVPYQVCVGNHDLDFLEDYNEYSNRFHMPGNFDSLAYSWNLGPIHFVAISTEFYFYSEHLIEQQYNWLKNDLEEANKVRDSVPWIIVYGHTPMYCSNDNKDSCTKVDSPLRVGCENDECHGLEDLFYEHGVDLQIYGHEHSYETSFPLYNYTVYNGSAQEPYRNPPAPVHVITGAAGNKWDHDEYDDVLRPRPEWSRIRNMDYSYSRMRVVNSSHLEWEQIGVPPLSSENRDTWVIDSFTLIKDSHGPYPPLPIN